MIVSFRCTFPSDSFSLLFITRTLHSLTHGTVPRNRETAIISIDRAVTKIWTAASSATEKHTSDLREEGRIMGQVGMSKCLGSNSCHTGRSDFIGAEVFTGVVCSAIHNMIIRQGRSAK